MKRRILLEIKEWSRSILWGAIFVYFFTGYVFKAYRVEGRSMQPLLQDGERLFVNRIVYTLGTIKRGDVVVFYFPGNPKDFYIKRVLGMPGETVSVRNGQVFIGNEKVDDHFVPEYFRSYENVDRLLIPRGYYFVAGDHRNQSFDSREWAQKPGLSPFVPQKYIVGKAAFRYWPLSKFGLIDYNFAPLTTDVK